MNRSGFLAGAIPAGAIGGVLRGGIGRGDAKIEI